jgi:class 3 adenylate cyclase
MEKEIANYVSKLLSEEDGKRWIIIVAEIVKRFDRDAVENILEAIKRDSLTKPDLLGIVSLRNSAKWNSLALTYYHDGFLKEAFTIWETLLGREPDNSATQNNFAIALMAYRNFNDAEILLRKAYETDKKRAPERAKEMPAYQNLLLLLEKGKPRPPLGRAQTVGNPSFHNILFMDIVGFSKWYGTVQVEKITFLNETVRTLLEGLGLNYMKVPMLPTGDGMALFFENVEHPIRLAVELTRRLKEYNKTQAKDMKLEVRIGIHAGDSFEVNDLHGGGNRCGPAINTARRVLDLGQARHILCTSEYGIRLKLLFGSLYEPLFHDCGEYTVKHGEMVHVWNIYDREIGNPNCPPKNCADTN